MLCTLNSGTGHENSIYIRNFYIQYLMGIFECSLKLLSNCCTRNPACLTKALPTLCFSGARTS